MSQKYYNQNSTLLDPKPVRDYVSPDGMWAVVPCIGEKEWVIIHNGSVLSDVSRTFQSAMNKVEKYKKGKSGSQRRPKPHAKQKSKKNQNKQLLQPSGGKGSRRRGGQLKELDTDHANPLLNALS
jgi:hypothetical protein